MQALIVFSAVLAVASAGLLGVPGYYSPLGFAAPASSQYHAQDELGQYSYGYAAGPSSKSEVKTADGVTRGAYSYVDANGLVQQVQYVSDPVNGFRVAATNLPVGPSAPGQVALAAPAPIAYAGPIAVGAPAPVQDTPEVAAAKAQHAQAHAAAAAAAAVPSPVQYAVSAAPVPVQDTPDVVAAKIQHAQAHATAAAAAGVQSPVYLALSGAHVGGAPLPVQDTPEVAAAKAQHAQAHAEALARASY